METFLLISLLKERKKSDHVSIAESLRRAFLILSSEAILLLLCRFL